MADANDMTQAERPVRSQRSVAVLAGRYRVLALLGAGGMGSVYLADDAELGEKVALKMLTGGGSTDPAFIEQLRSEVRLARRVTHPHVARVYDIAEHDGARFLTMEYVEGESLSARLAREGAFDLPSFFRIARDLTAGLAAAHHAGVFHRDLKPANILLRRDGGAVITDFGIATTRDAKPEAFVVGTPAFMAPEQLVGRFDARTDIFGLGTVLYCMLAGTKPFSGRPGDRTRVPSPSEVRRGLCAELEGLVVRCLQPLPDSRFSTVDALAGALAGAEAAPDLSAPPSAARSDALGSRFLAAVEAGPRRVLVRAVATDDAVLAVGLCDEISDRLGEVAALSVVREEDRAHEVRAEVGVTRRGDAIVVVASLMGAHEPFEFWRGSFEGPAADAIRLAHAATAAIEQALAIDTPEARVVDPLGPEAVGLYLEGRAAYRELWPPSLRRASAAFERALALSPDHPFLLAGLATARARQCFFGDVALDSARETAERAVSLAPNLADAHVARAIVFLQDSEAELALGSLKRALELAPGHVRALTTAADILAEAGAPMDAIRLGEVVLGRDPANDFPLLSIARVNALLGHSDRARAVLARATTEAGRHVAVGLECRFAMWRRDARTVEPILAGLRASGADREQLTYKLTFLIAEAVLEGRPTPPYAEFAPEGAHPMTRRRRCFGRQTLTEVDAFNGDLDTAMARIEEAVDDGLFDAFWLDRCPVLDPLRGSERFEAARETVLGRAWRALARLRASPT